MDPRTIPLHDIHLPPPVGWWPPAPGWWALGVLLLTALVWGTREWQKRRRSAAPSHADTVAEVWRTWRGLQRTFADPHAVVDGVQQLSELMRRVALTLNARGDVAGLTGEKWLRFLDAPLGGTEFSNGPGRILASTPYQPGIGRTEPGEVERCMQLCERWLKTVLDTGGAGR
ncbi:MAG: DUF4381 domain-containing protein [Gammaproteobacteria bacterium]|nr:DUF4381 domain-containing protein [Gammaproteobacteria bacterium]MCG3145241.1 hypothetical protein [Gammaproteobacteria bacterium]